MDGELASSCMDLLGVDELAGQVIFQGLCVVIRGAIRIVFNSEEEVEGQGAFADWRLPFSLQYIMRACFVCCMFMKIGEGRCCALEATS